MELPFGDNCNNVTRVARMMGEFARETQAEIERERGELRRVYGREVQER